MNEYEHLKKQKDEMLVAHRAPGSKCPFGCPHEREEVLRAELAKAEACVKELERQADVRLGYLQEAENGIKKIRQQLHAAEDERDALQANLDEQVESAANWKMTAVKLQRTLDEADAVAEWLHGLAEIVRPFSSYVVHGDSACFACDMGEAGPGPKNQHDPDCQIKKLLDHLVAEPGTEGEWSAKAAKEHACEVAEWKDRVVSCAIEEDRIEYGPKLRAAIDAKPEGR